MASKPKAAKKDGRAVIKSVHYKPRRKRTRRDRQLFRQHLDASLSDAKPDVVALLQSTVDKDNFSDLDSLCSQLGIGALCASLSASARLQAAAGSTVFQLNPTAERVRRLATVAAADLCTVVLDNLPQCSTVEWLRAHCQRFGAVVSIRFAGSGKQPAASGNNQCAFVQFADPQAAVDFSNSVRNGLTGDGGASSASSTEAADVNMGEQSASDNAVQSKPVSTTAEASAKAPPTVKGSGGNGPGKDSKRRRHRTKSRPVLVRTADGRTVPLPKWTAAFRHSLHVYTLADWRALTSEFKAEQRANFGRLKVKLRSPSPSPSTSTTTTPVPPADTNDDDKMQTQVVNTDHIRKLRAPIPRDLKKRKPSGKLRLMNKAHRKIANKEV